jgi:hypothetical protein
VLLRRISPVRFRDAHPLSIPGRAFLTGVSGKFFGYTFDGCRALTTLSADLFSDVPGGVFTAIFRAARR